MTTTKASTESANEEKKCLVKSGKVKQIIIIVFFVYFKSFADRKFLFFPSLITSNFRASTKLVLVLFYVSVG